MVVVGVVVVVGVGVVVVVVVVVGLAFVVVVGVVDGTKGCVMNDFESVAARIVSVLLKNEASPTSSA